MKKIITILALFALSKGVCEDISWSFPPTVLSTPQTNTATPQVSSDPNGNVVAVWIENQVLKSKDKPFDSPWGSLNSISATGASAPALVSAFDGSATVVWVENTVVKASTKPLNGAWSSPVSLSSSGSSQPNLAIDSQGNVIAVWVQAGNLLSSIKPYGGSWESALSISSNAATRPCVAFNGSGTNKRILVVWEDSVDSTSVIYASTSNLSTAWSPKEIISDIQHQAANPQVAVNTKGNACAVWYSYDKLNGLFYNVVVQSASLLRSGARSEIVTLSQPGIFNPANLVSRIAYDSVGNTVAMWTTSFDGATYQIQSAVKPVFGRWSTPVDIVNANTFARSFDLSLSKFGDVLGFYMFYNGTALINQSIEGNISGFLNNNWSVPINVSTGNHNAQPNIVSAIVGNSINAAAVWTTKNGSTTAVVSATGSRTLLSPPSNLSVSKHVENLALFSAPYNVLSWQASPDPNTVGYLIYRNGMFLTQVDANTLEYRDDNQPANPRVTYGVAAISSQNTTSIIVSLSTP